MAQKKARIYVTETEFNELNMKEINEFPTYYASYENGIIAHKIPNGKIMLMRTPLNNVNYRQVCLRKENDPKPYVMAVSRAVALAWLEGKGEEVGHKNEMGRYGIAAYDSVENLYWTTHKENCNTDKLKERRRIISLEMWSHPKWAERQRGLIRDGHKRRKEMLAKIKDDNLF